METATASPPDARFVGVSAAARQFDISKSKMYELVHNGSIATVRLGARVLIPVAELDRFAETLLAES